MERKLDNLLSTGIFSENLNEDFRLDKRNILKNRKSIDRNLFQGYDIRGDAIAEKQGDRINLRPSDAYLIGLALGNDFIEKAQKKLGKFYQPKVFVASDNRLSSPSLKAALVEGFYDAGCIVDYTLEEVPTGAVSRKILISDYDISVQITGSHNPYTNNGFKITSKQDSNGFHDPNGVPSALFGNKRQRPFELINIYDRIVSDDGLVIRCGGHKRKIDGIVDEYINGFIAYFKNRLQPFGGKFKKNYYAVIDPGNGVGGCSEKLFNALGVKTISVFSESNGAFPNHPADPSKEDGVKYACEFVKSLNKNNKSKYIAIVFDGDGDRSGIIDEDGEVIYPEKIVVVNYVRFILENEPALHYLYSIGEKVGLALDVRGSSYMEELINEFAEKKKLGIYGEYIPAGYPSHRKFVREQIFKIRKIIETKKIVGKKKSMLERLINTYTSAETSGHFFYATAPEKYPDIVIDDGIFSAVNLLYIVDTLNSYEAKEKILSLKQKNTYLVKDIFEAFNWKPVSNEIRDRAPIEDDEKFKVIEKLKEKVLNIKNEKENGPFAKKIKDIVVVDGVRVIFEDGSFFLMRASNTSPKFTYKFEGPSQERLIEVIEEFLSFIKVFENNDIGLEEIKKEVKIQKSILESKRYKQKKLEVFKFLNFEKYISKKEIDSFLNSKVFKDHIVLVEKNVSSDRFGYRSQKTGIFGKSSIEEKNLINIWIDKMKLEGFRGMIHFGIGGQALGNRAQLETMGIEENVYIRVIEKLGTDITGVFQEFKKRNIGAHQIILHASSKSGTTDETLIAFQEAMHILCIELSIYLGFGAVFGEEVFFSFRKYLRDKNKNVKDILFKDAKLSGLRLNKNGKILLYELLRRIVFTTTFSEKQSRFYAFAKSEIVKSLLQGQELKTFSIPKNVGGRFSELSQSGAVTTAFAGRAVEKQTDAGIKLIPFLAAHSLEKNPALNLAVLTFLYNPEIIIFAYQLPYMKAEAQQKAQLFPESNGKAKNGAFVVTAIGNEDLNKKIKASLRLNKKKPPLVIIQNTQEADSSVPELFVDEKLKVPCFIYNRKNLSEENVAASALFFQEFTVRYGMLRTAQNFIDKKLNVRKLDFNKRNSMEFKVYSETDPQNQPFVELAKRSVSERAKYMFKNEDKMKEEIRLYYIDVMEKVEKSPLIERVLIDGNEKKIDEIISDKIISKINDESKKSFTPVDDEILYEKIESVKEMLPDVWFGRSKDRDKTAYEYLSKISDIFEDLNVLGNAPLNKELEKAAQKFAYLLYYSEKVSKIPLPIFYTHSKYADVLGLFYSYITGYDFGIGTREQHSFFQSILDGLDKTFTLLFDFSSPQEIVEERERQIYTFGLAKDYLHNLYPDMVRRLFLEEEANAIAKVGRSAAVIRVKGFYSKEALLENFRFIARGVYLKNAVS